MRIEGKTNSHYNSVIYEPAIMKYKQNLGSSQSCRPYSKSPLFLGVATGNPVLAFFLGLCILHILTASAVGRSGICC